MDASIIAFLVLLGGTPSEHVIEMRSIDDCMRAAEFVAQAQCMDREEYDSHLLETGLAASDIKPASGDLANPLQNLPSATQRRLRNVLNPTPTAPTTPIRRSAARKAAGS